MLWLFETWGIINKLFNHKYIFTICNSGYLFIQRHFPNHYCVFLPASWWLLSGDDDDGWWFEDAAALWILIEFSLYLYQRRRSVLVTAGEVDLKIGWKWEVWESDEMGRLQWNVKDNESDRDVAPCTGTSRSFLLEFISELHEDT